MGRGVDAVVFDWGGTLTPWHTIDHREQWRAYTGVYDPGRADELAGLLAAAEDALWMRARDHQRSGRLEELFAEVGVDASGERHEEAMAAYHAFWEPHTWTDPDVPGLLAGLRERGLKVGVLSNTVWTREFHEKVFARDGVLDLIDGAVYSSEIPWAKPHPEAFRAAVAAVGAAAPGDCVYVGDRPFDDIHGAHAAGLRTVLVPNSAVPAFDGAVPDAVISRLAELPGVIDRW